MFEKKIKWKCDFDESSYKIYDWNNQLAGYFFAHYANREIDDNEAEELHKIHANIKSGTLLLPFVRFNFFDVEDGMDIDDIFNSFSTNLKRVETWQKWLEKNRPLYHIVSESIFTSREDRNMLSILLTLSSEMKLGEKNIIAFLSPLLDRLHQDGLV